MVKKILSVAGKVLAGLFLFYTILGFVIIPLILQWGIKDQGTKFLKHPVEVRSVRFNPFTLRIDIEGLRVLSAQKTVMAGWERFVVNVSALNLLRGAYRVEADELDGLLVNVNLLAGNKIDLLDLIPVVPVAKTETPASGKAGLATAPQKSAPLPVVIVDKIALKAGKIHFVDQTLQPNFETTLGDIDVDVTGVSTKPDASVKTVVAARLDHKGAISVEALVQPFVQPIALETTFSLDGYAMTVLTPYVGKYTGRALSDGTLEFKMTYRIEANQLKASHKILIQKFNFGQKVESKDALPLPFGLAVALLEDPSGRINITLPVSGDMSSPEFHYWHLVGQVVRNFFMSLVTKPFSFLGSMLGAESGTDELGVVRFLPGKVDLSDAEISKLETLARGLKERPKLRLEINGSFDPQMDWRAIKADALANDFKELRKNSTKTDSWIYQMLYQRRFGIQELWKLTKRYKEDVGEYKEEALVQEVKRQLIENASPDKVALEALALARAKAIYDRLVAFGFDAGHMAIGQSHDVQGAMGQVPLEFTLTVFEDKTSQEMVPAENIKE